MPSQLTNLVLLPGMDGTGELFAAFVAEFASEIDATIVRYPHDVVLSRTEAINLVHDALPESAPFVLLAESFSSPLAIHCAAASPPNLKGLILCAGFATSPLRAWTRSLVLLFSPLLFPAVPPSFVIRSFLVGPNAPASLVNAVRTAISSVRPEVMLSRLQSVLACDVLADLAKITVPILCLRAEKDRLVPQWCSSQIQAIAPQTVAVSIPASHLLLQCEPGQSARLVEDFLGTLT